jgi:putative lipoprotein
MAMRKEGWRSLAVSVLVLSALSGCAAIHPSGAGEGPTGATLTGIVTSRVRMVLPRDVMMRVELADISRQNAPPRTISLREIWPDGRQLPIPFEIPYGPAAIDPGRTYALLVKITQGRRILYENTAAHIVITNGVRSNIEVVVEPVPGP